MFVIKGKTPSNALIILQDAGYVEHYQGRGYVKDLPGRARWHAYVDEKNNINVHMDITLNNLHKVKYDMKMERKEQKRITNIHKVLRRTRNLEAEAIIKANKLQKTKNKKSNPQNPPNPWKKPMFAPNLQKLQHSIEGKVLYRPSDTKKWGHLKEFIYNLIHRR